MKKLLMIFLTVFIALAATSCTNEDAKTKPPTEESTENPTESVVPTPAPTRTHTPTHTPTPEPFPGKIGIVTVVVDADEIEYFSAMKVIDKFGKKKINHTTWPVSFLSLEQPIDLILRDEEVGAIILKSCNIGLDAAIKGRIENMNNIFTICIRIDTINDNIEGITDQVDIILQVDERGMGIPMARQAQKLGAKTFVHYSFPRHMEHKSLSDQRDLIRGECESLGLTFVDAMLPDPMIEVSAEDAQQFILEDVPKMIQKYGKDTAFFSTSCAVQISLINSVGVEGAIYPQPCHPSPYHGFSKALELPYDFLDPPSEEFLVSQIREALTKKGSLGKISTWPVDPSMLFTDSAAEYAAKWLNGEVPEEGIDIAVLTQLMTDYAGVQVYLTPYTDPETGITYDNYLMMRMDYITFE